MQEYGALWCVCEFLKILAWPVTLITALVILRQELKALLPRMLLANVLGARFEFSPEEAIRSDTKEIADRLTASAKMGSVDQSTLNGVVDGIVSENLQQVLDVAGAVLNKGLTFQQAIAEVAAQRRVAPQTVRDKCTRRIGLNTRQFQEYLTDRRQFLGMLLSRFPDQARRIEQCLGASR